MNQIDFGTVFTVLRLLAWMDDTDTTWLHLLQPLGSWMS